MERPATERRQPVPRNPQAVIFDVDGLIVDTEDIYYRTFNDTLQAHGGGLARAGYSPYVGHPVEDNSETAVRQYNLKVSPEAFCAEWMDRFDTAINDPEQIRLMPGILELLDHVRQSGYPLALASSTPRERMLTTVHNGLITRIDGVSSMHEVFSSVLSGTDVTHHKPDPEIYLKSAANLDVAPERCVAFEDSEVGVLSAKGAGMFVFAVPNFYTAHQDHSGADVLLESLTEVLDGGCL